MRGAKRVGPGRTDFIAAEKAMAKRIRRARLRQPYELRILRDLLWMWLSRLGLSDGEIALACRYGARSRRTVSHRLDELCQHLHEKAARAEE